ncbi:MAG: tyrosine-protein phosphatase [Actinomycetota bacterium]
MSFLDIHSHILPGIDDGAADEDEFLAMAQVALRGGTVTMVATPHWDLEEMPTPGESVPALVGECRKKLESRGLRLELLPGVEVRLNAGLYRLAEEGEAVRGLTLAGNGKYLLVDLPLSDVPLGAEETLFRLQLHGYVPILSHPERNRLLLDDPARLRGLVDRGVELQVNSGSLLGTYGRAARRAAAALLREGLARLMASDAHHATERGPDLSTAWEITRDLVGRAAADALLRENPRAVLAGEGLDPLPVEGPTRRLLRRRPGR